jgi:hypothetical protein
MPKRNIQIDRDATKSNHKTNQPGALRGDKNIMQSPSSPNLG